jgi:hypothetical protein
VYDDYRMNDPAGKAVLLALTKRRRTMKYICLGYFEKGKREGMTEGEQHAIFTHALNTTTIFAPTGILLVEKRFSLRKPP